ncbi:MAG: DNA mismatch repair protein MutS [Desulfovibrio sp.]
MSSQTPKKLTPMLEHYLQVKEQHPDELLFYRMGDFFEVFFEDAEIASRELQIALTCRNPSSENKTPMCGVPHHAVQGYLTQLLAKGYKVAVCDQVEDPRQAKGLVKREIIRVLTPGTLSEDDSLPAKSHNYLAALLWDADAGQGGLAWLDFSTGAWSGLTSRREEELWQWAVKAEPSELLLPKGMELPGTFSDLASRVTYLPLLPHFDPETSRRALLENQGVDNLETLDLKSSPELVRACGAQLFYLRETQLRKMDHLGEFKLLNLSRHLLLDEVTERNLEIFRRLDGRTGRGTLWSVLDQTMTPMGGRLLEERLKRPWRELGPIRACRESVSFFADRDGLRADLRRLLDAVYDVERLTTRVTLGRATPKDLLALRRSLEALPAIQKLLLAAEAPSPALGELLGHWDSLEDLAELLASALADSPPPQITDGGLFRVGYRSDLDELIELTEHGEAAIQRLLEKERDECGIPKLKLGYNRVFGYYLEVSKAYSGQIPEHFIRRQTLVNCERYVTTALKEMEERLLSASDERKSLEYNLFIELRETLSQARERFMFMAGALAALDYWQGLAEAARAQAWTAPELHEGMDMEIEDGRHPVVEAAVGGNYIPNSLTITPERRILLITGPNMAGKSTVLRQAAIILILAQIGSFVPARKARLGLADRIFSRVGASDNLSQGQSTFMVEMMETARILRLATRRSLVILDEIGRGTSTFDGLALAWAVVEELSRRAKGGIRTLFATHYHELTSLEGRIDGLRNLNIAVKEWKGDIVFLRKLIPGPADKSYGIEVARLAGVPMPVVQRARELLARLEEKSGGERARSVERASQTLLPGMCPPPAAAPEEPQEHPLLEELRALDLNDLTPLQALTILHQWKRTHT